MSRALLIFASCFGLGLGLSGSVGTAHACECSDTAWWLLERDQIAGDGEPMIEAEFWTPSAYLYVAEDGTAGSLWLELGDNGIRLRPVP